MTDNEESSSRQRSNITLGTGVRSASGTVSLNSTPTSSHDTDDLSILRAASSTTTTTRSAADTDDEILRSRASSLEHTARNNNNRTTPSLERVYSEEDEELRKAKAMALAIQQHPNMTPEEVHQMHIGDEAQLEIIEQQGAVSKQQAGSTATSTLSKAKKNFRESQEKAKQRFKNMVGNAPTAPKVSSPAASTSSSTAAAAAAGNSASLNTSARSSVASGRSSTEPSKTTTASVDKRPGVSPAAVMAKRTAAAAAATTEPSPMTKRPAVAVADRAVAAKNRVGNAATTAKGAATTAATTAKSAARGAAGTATAKAAAALPRKPTLSMSLTSDVEVVDVTESKSADSASSKAVDGASLNKEKIRLSAIVWKRRSGLGKLSYTKAWERRRIILQGSKVFYFKVTEGENEDLVLDSKEASWFEQAAQNLDKTKGAPWISSADDPAAPRGYFDLLKEGATVGASSGHSGAPSPFAISVKVKSDTYWKLCFDSHATQMEWLAAMTDVVVNASVDEYNANLLLQADPRNEPSMFGSEYLPPPGDKGAGQQLWMLGEYRVSSEGLEEREVVVVDTAPEVSTSAASFDELHQVDRWILHDMDVRTLFAIVNVALVLSRTSLTMPQHFWYVLTFTNVGLWYCLVKGYKKKNSPPPPTAEAVLVEKSLLKISEIEDEIPSVKPVAGTTTVKLQNPSDSPERNGQVFGAWCAPGGENIAVRSRGYLTSKAKIPSPGELYTLANVDIFESRHRYPDMAKRVTLPKVSFEGDGTSPKTWYAPDVFIVSVALPTDPPKMRSSNDGGGFTITMYFTMQQETRDILRRVTAESYDPSQEPRPDDVQKSKVNAVKLFNEYCRRAPNDPTFQSRFKVVANAQNLKEIGMPTWISKYNGKPVLIKRPGETGFLFSHPELSCMEFDVSFHPFPYLAKQAISYMKDNFFKKVLVTFAFVIEGRSDDELPECVIGLMQLCYPDPIYAIQAPDFFAGASPKSF